MAVSRDQAARVLRQEAVETTTGRVVSSNSCAMAWLDLSDPPLLNLPSTASNVAFQRRAPVH